ncbi:hypothetical protein TNIN_310791 [Trichonephila inaurata madagascariensis]|uniref:Uncharacterized protein n=1 Tax=Trichonephila inaurata madagascariensis TaxID=2747483 RepID=A0A8X6XWX4_9ARAC|nr:hypothetical protein TNIN_310791 [Trichonephila inaurata madagascariensis]
MSVDNDDDNPIQMVTSDKIKDIFRATPGILSCEKELGRVRQMNRWVVRGTGRPTEEFGVCLIISLALIRICAPFSIL